MAILIADRVQETSTSPGGTGTLTLTGSPVPGYKSFANGIGTGNSLYYTIYDAVTYAWEVGIGSWSANVLTRTTVLSNSLNTTAFISFTNGNTLNVWVDYPASTAVTQTDVGTAPNQVPLNQYLGKLAFQDVLDTVSNNPYYDTQISDVEPTLNLDFVNSKTLDSRITFTRSTTATYYDGKTSALAEQNLFLYSQDFVNSPSSKTNVTLSNNTTTAPDGTTTAGTMLAGAATSAAYFIPTVNPTAVQITCSYYFKAGTLNYVQILAASQSGIYCNFDLSLGVVGTNTGCTYSIVSVGSSWYRCSITYVSTGTAGRIGVPVLIQSSSATAAQSYTWAGTESIYIWGAQLEQRSSATAYNATTTTALTNYIPTLQTAAINQARLDYNPVTGTPNGLLIEEQRTNLAYPSANLFSGANATITNANNISPDGTLNASLITDNTTNGGHYTRFIYGGAISSSTAYTASIYVKAGSLSWVAIDLYSLPVGSIATTYVNLSNGQVGTTTGSGSPSVTTNSVGNGWWRVSLTGTTPASATTLYFTIFTATGNGTSAYAGTGYGTIQAWGAQLEAGAFPTSYIPTVASQVTRSADSAVMTGTNYSSWYGGAENTWYISFSYPFLVNANRCLIQSSANGLMMYSYGNGVNSFDNINYIGVTNSIIANQPCKFAVSQSSSSATQWCSANGVLGTSNIYNKVYFSTTFIGLAGGSTGYIQKLSYFPKALPSSELQEMTS